MKTVQLHVFLFELRRRQIEKRLHGDERVANVMTQAGGEQSQADHAVGDHHVVKDGELLAEKLVPLALDDEEFQRAFQRGFERGRVPRFGDVFVNGAAVDGRDRRVHVGIGSRQDSNDPRLNLPRLFQQPNPLVAGHALVGHQNTQRVLVLLHQLQSVIGPGRGQNPKLVFEGKLEILQGLLFVVHVKNGELFVIVIVVHKSGLLHPVRPRSPDSRFGYIATLSTERPTEIRRTCPALSAR